MFLHQDCDIGESKEDRRVHDEDAVETCRASGAGRRLPAVDAANIEPNPPRGGETGRERGGSSVPGSSGRAHKLPLLSGG